MIAPAVASATVPTITTTIAARPARGAAAADPSPAGSAPPIAARLHRETFFAAQSRYRRRARLLSAICVLPIAVLAIFIAALISPWFFLLLAAALRLLRLAGPLHGLPLALAEAIRGLLLPVREYVDSPPVAAGAVVRSGAGLLAPSIVLLFLLWLWVRLLFRGDMIGGVLLRVGAREAVVGDLEEQQLVDVVAEMALAAGMPQPRVLLIPGNAVNAAVVGSSSRDCTVVVSRRLLDTLDRDETQGVLADLLASAANGDLGISLTILSVFQTIGLVLAGRDLLLSRVARRTVWSFLRLNVQRGGTPEERAGAVAATSDLMLRSTAMDGLDQTSSGQPSTASGNAKARTDGLGKLGFITVWPYIASSMFRLFMMFYLTFITGPLLGWIWRTRRYLADATAVRLTRNPDGLSRALVRLGHSNPLVAGGAAAAHLFVVGPEAMHYAMGDAMAAMRAQSRAAWQASKGQPLSERLVTMRALQAQAAQRLMADPGAHPDLVRAQQEWDTAQEQSLSHELGMHSLHPPIGKRLRRLQALGAHLDQPARARSTIRLPLRLLGYTLIGLLVLVVGGLLLLVFAMVAAFAALANFCLSIPVLLLADWLLGKALR